MKRLPFLAAVASLWGGALTGTGRADFIYTFTTTTPTSIGSGSVSVAIDVADAVVAAGSFDATNISSLSLALSGTSLPFFDIADNSVADLLAPPVAVDGATGAFLGLTPAISVTKSGEEVEIAQSASTTGVTFTVIGGGAISQGTGEWTVTETPEPVSLTLLGIGAAGLLGYGWRRRR
jgi:hypothetical protein